MLSYCFIELFKGVPLPHEAAKLKERFRIAYADCFAAALALEMNAPLVTGDPDFRKMEEKVAMKWI